MTCRNTESYPLTKISTAQAYSLHAAKEVPTLQASTQELRFDIIVSTRSSATHRRGSNIL